MLSVSWVIAGVRSGNLGVQGAVRAEEMPAVILGVGTTNVAQ